jgi:hypothetical protein
MIFSLNLFREKEEYKMALFNRSSRGILVVSLLASQLLLSGCFDNRAQSGAGLGALGGGLVGSLAGPSKNREQNALIGAVLGD